MNLLTIVVPLWPFAVALVLAACVWFFYLGYLAGRAEYFEKDTD